MSRSSARGRVAALSRSRTPEDPVFIEARRDLAAAGLVEYAQKLVAKWPPLTNEQIENVAAILRSAGGPA